MMSRSESRFASQKSRLVAVAVMAVLWSIGVQWVAAGRECSNLNGNRDIFRVVDWICEDCHNIFRGRNLATLCRRNCFWNTDFLWCVNSTERHSQRDDLTRFVAILNARR
uniref:MIH-VIH family peptide 2 n=1 Tax=Metopograpsus thukuhar TaxID=156081 RepID=A0A2I6QG67_9EUCA|nr:MIH-VIH family peptide 2 [Metopograpsus thukuhar]